MVSIQQDTEHYRYQYITTRHGALLVSLEYNKIQGINGINTRHRALLVSIQDTEHYWYQYNITRHDITCINITTKHRALLL